MNLPPPPDMKQATWDYLLRFTSDHEVKVYHMYNNKASAGAKQDVTCGIGFFLEKPESALDPEIKALFFNKTTRQPATPEELKKDWETASNILRTWGNAPNLETDYAQQCQLAMDPDKTWTHLQTLMKRKLALVRRPGFCQAMDDFADMPAQAQAGLASFNYGFSVSSAHIMCSYLIGWDFDAVAKCCYTTGISSEKLLGNRTLFWNAARILEQNADSGFDGPPGASRRRVSSPALTPAQSVAWNSLPQKTRPPELTPYKAMPGREAPAAPDAKSYPGY